MADDVPHDGAPHKVPPPLSPLVKVEEPAIAEADEAVEGIAADFEAEFAPGLEPEPLPLRTQPFDPVTYDPRTHMLASGGMMCFDDFAGGMPEDVLLREPYSHLGYGAVTARDWYNELPYEVCDLVDEIDFGLFYTRLSRHMANWALLRALVERW
ncbi:hypothetical protein CsSME_00032177 [Camellia sinensis var. sinensis]